jgi:hypothetical protein
MHYCSFSVMPWHRVCSLEPSHVKFLIADFERMFGHATGQCNSCALHQKGLDSRLGVKPADCVDEHQPNCSQGCWNVQGDCQAVPAGEVTTRCVGGGTCSSNVDRVSKRVLDPEVLARVREGHNCTGGSEFDAARSRFASAWCCPPCRFLRGWRCSRSCGRALTCGCCITGWTGGRAAVCWRVRRRARMCGGASSRREVRMCGLTIRGMPTPAGCPRLAGAFQPAPFPSHHNRARLDRSVPAASKPFAQHRPPASELDS